MKHFVLSAAVMIFLNPLICSFAEESAVATVNGKEISVEEMEAALKPQMFEVEVQAFELKEKWLEQRIETLLLEMEAARRKTTVEKLEKKEIEGKIKKVTEKEIKAFYDQNVDKFTKPGAPKKEYAEVKPKIQAYLDGQRARERRSQFLDGLRKKAAVEIRLIKPEPPKVSVEYSPDNGMIGQPNAPVTIVEFTDYQCPFCVSSQQTLHQILEKYPGQVKVVTRDFPLSGHEGARPMALAALCAKDQGKYEEYRSRIFGMEKPTEDGLREQARLLGLDSDKFQICLSSKKYDAQINRDITDGQSYGVRGTPAFFVNGYPIMGAAPLEDFEAMIKKAISELN